MSHPMFFAFAAAALRAGRLDASASRAWAEILYPVVGYNPRLWRVAGGAS